MSVIIPKKLLKVSTFHEFCTEFNIKTHKKAGEYGFDEELIVEELDKIKHQKWIVNFINDRNDGYFIVQQIE